MTSVPLFTYIHTPGVHERTAYAVRAEPADAFIDALRLRGHLPSINKLGDALIAATFTAGTRLEQGNLTSVTALILDIDGGQRKGGVFVPDNTPLEWFTARLPFRGVAHTSYSHTEEHWKFRLIFPLVRPVTAQEHRRLWAWAHRCIEEKADPACKNPDRLFFLPRCPQPNLHLAWIKPLEGPWLSMESIPDSFHLADENAVTVPLPPTPGQSPGSGAPAAPFDEEHQALLATFMSLPLVAWAVANPAAVSREVWRGLALNLRAMLEESPTQLADPEFLEATRKAFHEISAADTKRYNVRATNKIFEDARKSLFELSGPMSFAHMRTNGAPDDVVPMDGSSNAIMQARRTHRRLQAAEYYAKKEAEVREAVKSPVFTAAATPEAKPTVPVNPPAPPAPAPAPAAPSLPPPASTPPPPPPPKPGTWSLADSKRFFYDEQAQAYRYILDPKSSAISRPLNERTITHILCHDFSMPSKAAKKVIETFHIINDFIVDPSKAYGIVPRGGRVVFNAFTPPSLKPVQGNWDNYRKLIMVLCGGDVTSFTYFMDWLACPLQSIHVKKKLLKMLTAVALSGSQGTGKGTIERAMTLIYGEAFVASVGQELLDSPYQGVLFNKLFVVADECKSHDKASGERLKRLITSKQIDIEEKYVARVTVSNYANYLFTTNDERPVRVEKTDRRFTVFYTLEPDPVVLDAVWKDLEGPQTELAAFFYELLNRNITSNLDRPCDTEARRAVQSMSMSPVQTFIATVREVGLLEVAAPWMSRNNTNHPSLEPGSKEVSMFVLSAIYKAWAHANGLRSGTDAAFFRHVRKEGLVGESKVKRVNGLLVRYVQDIPFEPVDPAKTP